jgi:hypothetical protein
MLKFIMLTKRGLSSIVSSTLIIVIAVVAAVLLYTLISTTINNIPQGEEQQSLTDELLGRRELGSGVCGAEGQPCCTLGMCDVGLTCDADDVCFFSQSLPDQTQQTATTYQRILSYPSYYRVFVTSQTFDGNLSGLTGADAKCQQAANSAGLGGNWKAYIGEGSTSPESRILKSTSSPYKRLDGVLIANNWSDLTDGKIAAQINIDEFGQLQNASYFYAWTGSTGSDGKVSSCRNWTYDNKVYSNGNWTVPTSWTDYGSAGIINWPDYRQDQWYKGVSSGCHVKNRLYCIEQAQSTSVITCNAASISTSVRKIYYQDSLNAARTVLIDNELPDVLADGYFEYIPGERIPYTQTLTLGPAITTFGDSFGNLEDPALYIKGGLLPGNLYNYTLTSTRDIQYPYLYGQKITLLGRSYTVGKAVANTQIDLFKSGESLFVLGGETKTVMVGGMYYTIKLVTTSSDTQAAITVNGLSKSITEGNYYEFNGAIGYINNVVHPAQVGDARFIDIVIGTDLISLVNGAPVRKGIGKVGVRNTNVALTNSYIKVQVAMQKPLEDQILEGQSFADPVFGGLDIIFTAATPSLDSSSRARIVVDTDNTRTASVTFTSALAGVAGEQKFAYAYDNSTTGFQPLLANSFNAGSDKGYIHVKEGEWAKLNDFIVINQGDKGAIVEVTDVDIDTDNQRGTITLTDALTDKSETVDVVNSTNGYYTNIANIFGGQGYVIKSNEAGTLVSITWEEAPYYNATTIFPRIKLANGGWLAFLTETTVPAGTKVILPDGRNTQDSTGVVIPTNGTFSANGIDWVIVDNKIIGISNTNASCYFPDYYGPAILFLEPKKWNDVSYGNHVCIPMSSTSVSGTAEPAISDPIISGINSGLIYLASDTYRRDAVDEYGSFIVKEDRTNENGKATISYPVSQMYFDIFARSLCEPAQLQATCNKEINYFQQANCTDSSGRVIPDGCIVSNGDNNGWLRETSCDADNVCGLGNDIDCSSLGSYICENGACVSANSTQFCSGGNNGYVCEASTITTQDGVLSDYCIDNFNLKKYVCTYNPITHAYDQYVGDTYDCAMAGFSCVVDHCDCASQNQTNETTYKDACNELSADVKSSITNLTSMGYNVSLEEGQPASDSPYNLPSRNTYLILTNGYGGVLLEVLNIDVDPEILSGTVTFQDRLSFMTESITLTKISTDYEATTNIFFGSDYTVKVTPDGKQVSITWPPENEIETFHCTAP